MARIEQQDKRTNAVTYRMSGIRKKLIPLRLELMTLEETEFATFPPK